MGLATQDERKVIDGIITIVHEHLDIIQDPGAQVLGFINGQEQGLSFFFVQIGDLFLDGFEHTGLTAFIGYTEEGTELFVKISHADGGQAQVFHVEETGIQTGSKASESVRLSHARFGSKYPDPPDILEIIQTVGPADGELLTIHQDVGGSHVIRKIADIHFCGDKLHGNIIADRVNGNGGILPDIACDTKIPL